MNIGRRSFLKTLIGAATAASLAFTKPKETEAAIEEAPAPKILTYEEMMRRNLEAHMRDIERAFFFGPAAFKK